jgi:glutamate/tyrosine decarboxylase-like PLP-dependent enzyme
MESITMAAGVDLDSETFRRLGYQAVDLAADYLATIGDGPVYQRMRQADRQGLLDMPLPEQGLDPATILTAFERQVLPYPMGNGHPRFHGWVNSPPAPIGAVAEFLAAVMNPASTGGDFSAVYLERAVTGWLMDLLDFPREGSFGLLVSGGSMASLTCLTAARQRAVRDAGGDVRRDGLQGTDIPLVLYLASEGHTTMLKAAELLGIGRQNVRLIAVDQAYRMDVDALRATVLADRKAGKLPFCVAASAGTASTGAVDPLDDIATLCEQEGLWFHLDGAYGAPGVLDPAVAPIFAGMERADSIAIDPHKWFSVPVECGCALVRDGELLRETFSLVPSYVKTEEGRGIGGLPWYSEYGFQQTRGFRSLKLWMVLAQFGRDGLVAHVAHCNRLAARLAGQIEAAGDFELLAPRTLSIVCFRYLPPDLHGGDAALNDLNREIVFRIQEGGELFLTQADLSGRFALRACFLNYLTTEAHVDLILPVIRRIAGQAG